MTRRVLQAGAILLLIGAFGIFYATLEPVSLVIGLAGGAVLGRWGWGPG